MGESKRVEWLDFGFYVVPALTGLVVVDLLNKHCPISE